MKELDKHGVDICKQSTELQITEHTTVLALDRLFGHCCNAHYMASLVSLEVVKSSVCNDATVAGQ